MFNLTDTRYIDFVRENKPAVIVVLLAILLTIIYLNETNDYVPRKKKGSEPKDWIESLNKLFEIHEKKITSKIWVFNKRVDRPYTKDEEVDGGGGLPEYNPVIERSDKMFVVN